MTMVISKVIQEVERSSRQSNHTSKGRDYHDNTPEYPYTRDTAVSSCSHSNTVVIVTA